MSQSQQYKQPSQSPTREVKKPTMKRRGSKFDLADDDKAVLYRPEFQNANDKKGSEKMWSLMKSYLGNDVDSIQR
jgi:hypothetical protein